MKLSSRIVNSFVALILATGAAAAQATIVTFQQGVSGYTGSATDTVISNVPNSAFPGDAQVGTFSSPGASNRAPLVRFNTSSLAPIFPANQVTAMSLRFTGNGDYAFPTGTPVTWSLYEVSTANKDWTTASTFNQKNGSANWASGFAFGGAGAPVSGTDYLAPPLATLSFTYDGIPGNIPSQWTWSFSGSPAALTALVQQWSGTQSNNAGIWLLLDNYGIGGRYLNLFGTGTGTATNRPLLTIEYSPVPEPSGMLLALVGYGIGACVMRRRSL